MSRIPHALACGRRDRHPRARQHRGHYHVVTVLAVTATIASITVPSTASGSSGWRFSVTNAGPIEEHDVELVLDLDTYGLEPFRQLVSSLAPPEFLPDWG